MPRARVAARDVNDSRRQTPRFFPAVFSRERASDQVLRRIRRSHAWRVQDVHDSNWPACPYRPPDPDQQDRADEPSNQVADPSA